MRAPIVERKSPRVLLLHLDVDVHDHVAPLALCDSVVFGGRACNGARRGSLQDTVGCRGKACAETSLLVVKHVSHIGAEKLRAAKSAGGGIHISITAPRDCVQR